MVTKSGTSWFGIVITLVAIALGVFLLKGNGSSQSEPYMAGKTIFDFTVESSTGKPVSLSEHKGKKAYLIVNVASKCGLTKTNYAELTELYEKLGPKGLEILAFPCNNFGGQEPDSNEAICEFAASKGATYPVFGKLECEPSDPNDTHPLYRFLKTNVSGGWMGNGLKWNFSKFLVNADGVPIKRYLPITSPAAIEKDILPLLE